MQGYLTTKFGFTLTGYFQGYFGTPPTNTDLTLCKGASPSVRTSCLWKMRSSFTCQLHNWPRHSGR